ncbi:MAG: hypothetical protein ACLVJ8_02080 [Ruthenibacterium lactatiformans]
MRRCSEAEPVGPLLRVNGHCTGPAAPDVRWRWAPAAVLWGAADLSCGAFITGASVGLGLLSGYCSCCSACCCMRRRNVTFSSRGAHRLGNRRGLCAAASAGTTARPCMR